MEKAIGIFLALLTLTSAGYADVSDSGNLSIGGQGVITGTMTVQGNAFSVGGATFTVSGGTVSLGGLLKPSASGIQWMDGSVSTTAMVGGISGVEHYLVYADTKPQNTSGGTFNNGAWRTRTLTVEEVDTGNDGSLASNQITLTAGTYRFRASAPAKFVDYHITRFVNVTDNVVISTGTSAYDNSGGADMTRSEVVGRFTITGTKAFELQHICTSSQGSVGFGQATNLATERYAVVELWKEP